MAAGRASQPKGEAHKLRSKPELKVCTFVHIIGDVYEWDDEKAQKNLRKHGIDFADAIGVLEDDLAVTVDEAIEGETRSITIGTDPLGRILVVVYTWRSERIRMISARPATPRERRQYEGSER